MKRNDKIAQLPETIRTEINIRLCLKHSGTKILKWLNKLPEVKAVMAEHFGGHPLNGQNLAEWKNGGYMEWHTKYMGGPSLIERDPEFRNSYFSLLGTYVQEAHSRIQREIVACILDALQQQARLEKNPAQPNPANN